MTSIPDILTAAPASSESAQAPLAPIVAALAGAVLVYLAGFSTVEALHNGAHDARHAAALPCH